ncbi:MAG: acetylxylan esterase [candidate division KSB1 bacterium]|nr:acetylxylan esterase [candidate division KSB1 bacterium]
MLPVYGAGLARRPGLQASFRPRTRVRGRRWGLWLLLGLVCPTLFSACSRDRWLDLRHYYDYDARLPLEVTVDTVWNRPDRIRLHVTYTSVHDCRVTALWTLPKLAPQPVPAILVQHGLGDRKEVDYVEAADSVFTRSGFAVFRIDFQYHGERRRQGRTVRFDEGLPFTARDAWAQTVFDLRRAVDFLDSRPEIDPARTGFLGISLGGILGTVFVAVEPRIEAPILALAGGGLRFVLRGKAFDDSVRRLLAPIEPLNFVDQISPRPLLFVLARQDEIIPQASSLLLYRQARKPKQIWWYEGRHRTVPVWRVMEDCALWYKAVFAGEKLPDQPPPK